MENAENPLKSRQNKLNFNIMGLISKMVDKKSQAGKLNEGQYGFKPWMANLIMGILELALVIVWLCGSVLTVISAMLSLDIEIFEEWDATTSIVLAAAYLVWNLLVWIIKPLRTRFNYSESIWNLFFIAWLIYDSIRTMIS